LLSNEAAYLLTIDSQLAIDTLLLQSSQTVDVLEIIDCVSKKNIIRDPNQSSNLLMTLKMNSAS